MTVLLFVAFILFLGLCGGATAYFISRSFSKALDAFVMVTACSVFAIAVALLTKI